MGRRKERRLAAMMSSGRRMKLDILADPSGEMAYSPLDEGGDLDQDRRAGGPTSPSSSGGKQENPLFLLGQYSDDEMDEETSKQKVEVEITPQVEPDDKVKQNDIIDDALGSKAAVDSDTSNTKSHKQLATAKSLDAEENTAALVAQCSNADLTVQNGVDASDMQIVGDLPGDWRVVMHEQSKQYYYWNTLTGETSWVMPEGLTSESGIMTGADISSTSELKMECPAVFQAHLDPKIAAYPNFSDTNGHVTSDVVAGSIVAYGAMESSGLLLHSLSSNENKVDEQSSGNYGTAEFQFSQLILYGQNLLERSKTLIGSISCPEGIESIQKEIEIRLYDCQTLLSYGASLLPFWWHTENQLKRLETVIGIAEASSVEQKTSSIKENVREGPKIVETTSVSLSGDNNQIRANPTFVKTEASNEKSEIEDLNAKDLSSSLIRKDVEITNFTDTVIGIKQDTTAANSVSKVEDIVPVNSISKVEAHVEDVDMDVEMEIDDVAAASDTTTQHNITTPSLEHLIHTSASPVECRLSCPVEPNIPPPPEEDWIPPPPPDGEPVPPPPPPPEDPPIPDPLPYSDSAALTYQESYGSGYVLPAYSYYAPAVAEVPSSTYYMQNNGSYTGDAQQQPYYEPVAGTGLHEVTSGANLVGTVSFYDASVAVATNGATGTTIEPSEYYVASGPVSYSITASAGQEPNSVQNNAEVENNIIPAPKLSGPSRVVSSGHVYANNSSEEESGAKKGDAMAQTAASKSQNKVPRSKKRGIAAAPTLRSNKKVSSLLDKWMAAKEELHGEEDEEPVDAYELLEKKRQKEIEEWHASQIASRQALENANFQPLGGDWRERVKRRRAEAAKSQNSKPLESVEKEKKQPDLTELSKNLPSGWQAYWDESSKDVYYANSITSETTWIRP